eukprot:1161206-Pelagomonas_calceolata.AAC.12
MAPSQCSPPKEKMRRRDCARQEAAGVKQWFPRYKKKILATNSPHCANDGFIMKLTSFCADQGPPHLFPLENLSCLAF